MNNKLEEKLLLSKAKRYIDKIQGIKNLSISLVNEEEFQWHREVYSRILKGKEIPECKLELPVSREDVYSYMQSKIHIGECSSYYIFFEGLVIISFNIVSLHDFLSSYFALNKTFDISVLSLNPAMIIVISEEEYELNIFAKVI
ncbi:hypothetical protein Xmau_04519 [Xenorhabdus mauleonii]|uniref:Uncharacterized protein n=1 Tax=Xenorhabdus mauleonii TaxID=351675 RepID=A0A1I3Z2L3_9GAMM|nr:hypothetical protein [Xenorhabdus mauleonii]PHM33525.1 hypothetical protein Xmau_04519 [Xenorhabdus mauleonii]SFK37756.1 hypothetical protein SAMN05421680_1843 [Xenorhabdus mauleonii]